MIDLTEDGADNWLNLDGNSNENVIDLTNDSNIMDEESLEIKENCGYMNIFYLFKLKYSIK